MPATPGSPLRDAPPRMTGRGVARRAQILATAGRMFLDRGYDPVSVDEIIRAVGGSKTNLYRHFGDKEGLFVHVVEDLCDGFLNALETTDVEGLDVAGGLRVLARRLLGILLEDRHIGFQRLVIAESARFPDMARAWFASGPERAREIIAAWLERHRAAGQLQVPDPLRFAARFHDMAVTNLLYLALLGARPSEEEIAKTVDEAVAIFLHGVAPPGSGRASPIRPPRADDG